MTRIFITIAVILAVAACTMGMIGCTQPKPLVSVTQGDGGGDITVVNCWYNNNDIVDPEAVMTLTFPNGVTRFVCEDGTSGPEEQCFSPSGTEIHCESGVPIGPTPE